MDAFVALLGLWLGLNVGAGIGMLLADWADRRDPWRPA